MYMYVCVSGGIMVTREFQILDEVISIVLMLQEKVFPSLAMGKIVRQSELFSLANPNNIE